ncbi:GNAT family N-acetyltransferase [Parasphingorhabdus litoris]|uniref:GNAT family N-acetyltransferase n=1 Tax=Parasphingorhabdus litoris TaxID=394733 RepID=A0ABP3KFS7_9SPHN|nr:GNAT family N-acetyltransferase [Parasphingorhabdus litoris]
MNEPMHNPIRPIVPDDIPALKNVIEATDMFPSEMLDDIIAGFFNDKDSDEIWLTYEMADDNLDGKSDAMAVAYCRPEEMTDRTWNLLLIAVHPDCQGGGIGAALMSYIENYLTTRNQRVLIVETSGTDALARTREFYRLCQYDQESRIRDFYEDGDDKITFRKALQD